MAGHGKTWQRVSLGGHELPAESSTHLKHLQDELQRAVHDLGKLVGDESGTATSTPHKTDISIDAPPSGTGRPDLGPRQTVRYVCCVIEQRYVVFMNRTCISTVFNAPID